MSNLLSIWKKYSFLIFLSFIFLGLLNLKFALAALLCMILPIVFALLNKGRFWCGNLCPRGNFFDKILYKFSNNKKVSNFLKSSIFRILIILILFTNMGIGLYKNWGNLYGVGMLFYRLIVVTSLIGILLSFVYNHRVWCHFCPMGSISAFITKLKLNKKNNSLKSNSLKVSNTCVNCKLCEKKCPMNIKPYEYKNNIIDNVDCIKCKECVYVCPKKSIS